VRAAAALLTVDEGTVEHLFQNARVLVRLEECVAESVDAQETALFAVNQILRFCPQVALSVPDASAHLFVRAARLATEIHGERGRVDLARLQDAEHFQAVLNIGTEVLRDLPATTVNSSGWVARVADTHAVESFLHWRPSRFNPIGAHLAACLGVSRVFLNLVGVRDTSVHATEFSLFSHDVGSNGGLDIGPPLPNEPLHLDALLVGCGAVSNGWAYTMKRLPVTGRLDAVDRQSVAIENLGPYVAADRRHLGTAKAEMIRDYLAPSIVVTPWPEEFELFKIRLAYGRRLQDLVVNGLDNVETRHSVQQLWPAIIVDMGAGGLSSQVIVKHRYAEGLCLLGALKSSGHEESYAVRLARESGLQADRIRNEPTTPITERDVEMAPPEKRAVLEDARRRGQLICGRVTEHNLRMELPNRDFAPAVPFVTALSGVVGAAETMKCLIEPRHAQGLHFQFSARSGQMRALAMHCEPSCDCQRYGRR
jgi:ThiF family protein